MIKFNTFTDEKTNINSYCLKKIQCYRIEASDYASNGIIDGWFHLEYGGASTSSNVRFYLANSYSR